LILDSSFVETYSKKDEIGSEYSGYKEKNGFKLHQIIDYKTRLPLLQASTPGARADVVWGLKLIRAAPKFWDAKGLLADKAYDAEYLVEETKRKWEKIKVGIPIRQVRLSKKPEKLNNIQGISNNYNIKAGIRSLVKEFLNKRTEIERYFSRLKRIFNLEVKRRLVTSRISALTATWYLSWSFLSG